MSPSLGERENFPKPICFILSWSTGCAHYKRGFCLKKIDYHACFFFLQGWNLEFGYVLGLFKIFQPIRGLCVIYYLCTCPTEK